MQQVARQDMLVSVIVPVFNAEKYIRQTIQSVIDQTYIYWELIVVDDGSTDGGPAIMDSMATDNRIKVVHRKNSGVSDSRNHGASLAKGSFFCFLDADDLFLPACLEQRMKLSGDNPSLIHNDMEVIHADGRPSGIQRRGISGDVLEDLLLWEQTVVPGPSAMMVSRSVFEEIGGFDIHLSTAADQDFFIRAATVCTFRRIPEVLTQYRDHPQGMHRQLELMQRDHLQVYRKASHANLFRSFWFKQRCFSNVYFILAGSWWGDGKNIGRALIFLFLCMISYPPNVRRLFQRVLHGSGKN